MHSYKAWRNLFVHAWHHPLARRDRIGTFARILGWQLRSALDRSGHVVDWINGAKLVVRKGQSGLTGNLYFGLHEYADMAFFAHFLRPGDVFADIGSNAGSYTVLAAKVAGAQVHAFEPVPKTLADLRSNIAANNVEDIVEVHATALGTEPGAMRFTVGFGAANRFAAEDETDTISVPVSTADAELVGKSVTAMKIDVECAEHLVIGGMSQLLVEPQLLAIEVETLMDGVRDAIEGAGFVEMWYDPARRVLSAAPLGINTNNHLFIRDSVTVAERVRNARKLRFRGIEM